MRLSCSIVSQAVIAGAPVRECLQQESLQQEAYREKAYRTRHTGGKVTAQKLTCECSPIVAVAFAEGGDIRACVQVQEFPFLHAVVTTSACSCSLV